MSELRDLTAALRAVSNRITSVENCMLVLVRNSEQEAEWRHQQRNREMMAVGEREAQERATQQVQEACGAISHKLFELVERFDNQAAVRLQDVRALSGRVRKLEEADGAEEVTKA
jgi:uncharacterized FlaG/YvyC family protein